MLRSLVRYVRTTGAWLAEDHGIPNLLTDPVGGKFVESTKLSHMVLLAPVNEDEDFSSVDIENTRVNFYVVIPITTAEATWKREMGAEKSIYYVVGSQEEGGDDVLIDYVIDPARPCTVDDLNCREIFDNQSIEDSDYGEYEDIEDDEDAHLEGEVADDEELTDSNNNSGSNGSGSGSGSGSGEEDKNSTECAEEDSPTSSHSQSKVRFQLHDLEEHNRALTNSHNYMHNHGNNHPSISQIRTMKEEDNNNHAYDAFSHSGSSQGLTTACSSEGDSNKAVSSMTTSSSSSSKDGIMDTTSTISTSSDAEVCSNTTSNDGSQKEVASSPNNNMNDECRRQKYKQHRHDHSTAMLEELNQAESNKRIRKQ